MKDEERLEKIRCILKEEYGETMSEKDIRAFAKDLHLSVFGCGFGLDEVFSIVDMYEERANTDGTRWYYVFRAIIDLFDNCEKTAEIMYDSFMFRWDILEIFLKLYFENGQYISAEKLEKAKKKALKTFDRHILEAFGIKE